MSLESCLEIKVKIIPITINCTLTEPIAKKDPKDVTTKDETDETAKDRTARGMSTHISTFFLSVQTEIHFKIMMKSLCNLNEKQTL